jgi:hypothetical protein
MADLPLANPTLAKKVWESMAHPSTRRVATKLRQAGASISHMTVARWRTHGWRPLKHEPQHPLEAARACLDDAIPILTNDPMSTASNFVQGSTEREALERLTDVELLGRAAREVEIAVCLVANAMMRQAAIVVIKPAEVGVLMRALAECVQAATVAFGYARNVNSRFKP